MSSFVRQQTGSGRDGSRMHTHPEVSQTVYTA